MLQDWLDNNLPTLVERLVREISASPAGVTHVGLSPDLTRSWLEPNPAKRLRRCATAAVLTPRRPSGLHRRSPIPPTFWTFPCWTRPTTPRPSNLRIAKIWEDADAFRAGAGAEEGAEPFTIVIPPPNVTGSLPGPRAEQHV